jgi:hypothetical protein
VSDTSALQLWLGGGNLPEIDEPKPRPSTSAYPSPFILQRQFLSLLTNHLLHDMVVVYSPAATTVHTALRLGVPVCGHPQITHGGLTSAIFDETYGGEGGLE